MSEAPFYAPRSTHNPRRFLLEVVPDVVVGPPERRFMMGGVGLGSAIAALEQATARPLIWATAQYLSFAQPGQVVDIDVHLPVTGKRVTQARVVSHVGEKEIITINAALGARDAAPDAQFATMPSVPGPDAFEREVDPHSSESLQDRIDKRFVVGDRVDHEGHARIWMRAVDDQPVTAGLLAVFADFLPGAIPMTRGSSSLDNTLRIRKLVPTRWCLLDARILGVASGLFHGEMSLFAEDGTLIATASQSGVLPRSPH